MTSSSLIQAVKPYFPTLDGWRGVAIILVIISHWIPLGPDSLMLNHCAGILGMGIFFTLSGFLITNLLLEDGRVNNFLLRRFFRIVPLAYLYLVIILPLIAAPLKDYPPNFFFYVNLPPFPLNALNGHLWSLGVEIQFYSGIALLVLFFKKRGLVLLPFLTFAVTGLRIWQGKQVAIETYYRVDEIMAGACLALIYHHRNYPLAIRCHNLLKKMNPYIALILLMLSSHQWGGFLNYLRPYFTALLIGTTLYQNQNNLFFFLTDPSLKYIAAISYALYVIHPLTAYGWLDVNRTDSRLIRYLVIKPISIIILLFLAHFSTFYYENYWIKLGKKLTT